MQKIKDISQQCIKLIEHFECSGHAENFLNAYQDTGKVWTIGIGTTRYPDGTKVKQGDKINLDEAYEYCRHDLQSAAQAIDALTTDAIEQHQFDALASFVYNEGAERYRKSTLRKIINASPVNYKVIVPELLKWKYDNGIAEPGLLRRRRSEAYLYMYGELKFYFTNNDNII